MLAEQLRVANQMLRCGYRLFQPCLFDFEAAGGRRALWEAHRRYTNLVNARARCQP